MLSLVVAVSCLVLLILVARLNAFIALLLTAIGIGLAQEMHLSQIMKSVQAGVGSTLGSLALVISLGVVLGSILTETGAVEQISDSLLRLFGVKKANWAILITGFFIGIALFYNAGFVILVPLVFQIALTTGLPLVYLGLSMAASLSVTHGFLPPHPGPTAIVALVGADMGKTLLLGFLVAVPTLAVAGLLFPKFVRHIIAHPPTSIFPTPTATQRRPSFAKSLVAAMFPVLLMGLYSVAELTLLPTSPFLPTAAFLGNPAVAMLLGVLLALVLLGNWRGELFKVEMDKLMGAAAKALGGIAMILLIIAAGGAFKQVLTDSGLGETIAKQTSQLGWPPLVLGWVVATVVRIAIGSASVAGLLAAGLMQPIVAQSGVSPELMVLSIGAGSLMCSHVNDTGFWMFKEYFGLSLTDTFRTWTLMETIVGVMGLLCVLLLNVLL